MITYDVNSVKKYEFEKKILEKLEWAARRFKYK